MQKKHFIPFAILIALILLIIFSIIKTSNQQEIQVSEIGESNEFSASGVRQNIKLPEFSLPDLFDENKSFSLQNLVNDQKKYSLINFFASWCTTCRAEHEILLRLKDENLLDIYGIAWHDFKNNTQDFLEKNSNPFLQTALDSQGLFTRIINIKAVPETVLVDSTGTIVLRFTGNLTDDNILEIKNFLNKR